MNCPLCGKFTKREDDSWACYGEHDLPPRIYLNYPYPDEKDKLEKIREDIRKEKEAYRKR